MLVQLLFTRLLAGWSNQLRSIDRHSPVAGHRLGFVAALLLIDGFGWRVVAAMFDREPLVTGTPT